MAGLDSSMSILTFPVVLTFLFSYILILSVYRLYLSPIAKFPGPKLAGLTHWYEVYYDVVLNGKFMFHIQELHKKYGPIIRINPDELHIEDPDYFEELYARSSHRNKQDRQSERLGNPASLFSTSDHETHRIRRAALNPLFSRRQISENLMPVIRQKADLLCSKLAESRADGRVVTLSKAWCAFTGDIMTQFAFGKSYDQLESPEFANTFHEAVLASSKMGLLTLQFPWIIRLMNGLPQWFVLRFQPMFGLFFQMQRDIRLGIKEIVEGRNQSHKDLDHPTVFHTLLDSNLPPAEKSLKRLYDEAFLVVTAGLETTAWALSVGSFHIINSPEVLSKLRTELERAIPNPRLLPDLTVLEQLPFLHACTQECVRLSYGVSTRMPRVSPHEVMKYGDYSIPVGAPVSMTIPDVHHNESIFPDSRTFKPERWLNNPRAPNGSALDRYLVAFGKGGRSCLGINLAQAELHIALATVFRRFTFELYETDVTDVALAYDWLLPAPKLGSKGVRVKVTKDELYRNAMG